MKKLMKFLVPLLLGALIVASIVWYLFVYDRDFTRDTLLSQARYQDMYGNSRLSAWFYDAAYNFSGHDENVAIELANQYKHDGNYTKAELTLTQAIHNTPTVELYTALCKTFVEQDKLLDAVALLANVADPEIRASLEALRPPVPTPSAEAGFYSEYLELELTSEGSKYIFCSASGDYPSIARDYYGGPIPLEAGITSLQTIAVSPEGLVSPVGNLEYTITGVIEEVVFTDPAMESAIRQHIAGGHSRTLYTNELWDITEFTVPEGVATFADLPLLPNLKQLTVHDQKIDSLRHFASLDHLEVLDLTGCTFPVEELAELAQLPKLRELTLAHCGLSTIEALVGAPSLTKLDLSSNTVRRLDVLSGIQTLEEINLEHNAVTSLEALAQLPKLSKLVVNYNSVTSVSALSTCATLTHLEADHNQLTSVYGLHQLTGLQHLSVDYNALTDVSILSANTALVNLSIASNTISDITALKTLTKLEIFDFSGNNQISALPAWPEGTALKTIDGSYNTLTSIDGLKSMQQLTHVYMDYNQLTNIDALADCFCLVQVNVYGNLIPDVEALREHDIIVNYDPTVQ